MRYIQSYPVSPIPACLQEALSLSVDEAQDTLVGLLDSRAKGILENVKADAIEGRDGRILEAAERLLKWVFPSIIKRVLLVKGSFFFIRLCFL